MSAGEPGPPGAPRWGGEESRWGLCGCQRTSARGREGAREEPGRDHGPKERRKPPSGLEVTPLLLYSELPGVSPPFTAAVSGSLQVGESPCSTPLHPSRLLQVQEGLLAHSTFLLGKQQQKITKSSERDVLPGGVLASGAPERDTFESDRRRLERQEFLAEACVSSCPADSSPEPQAAGLGLMGSSGQVSPLPGVAAFHLPAFPYQ